MDVLLLSGGIQMNKKKAYIGLDYFRIVSAIFVIAIHTSPLSSYSEGWNFILTRIIGRVAVPFFFMTSGFFIFCEKESIGINSMGGRVKKFINTTTKIYGIAILLYLPINIYNGYFKQGNISMNLIKGILLDGTFYHLWYLPASILAVFIIYYGIKTLGYKGTFLISIVLYILGLLGDSYYGLIGLIPFGEAFYQAVFTLWDYTRNGLFFAPLFFVLGGMIRRRKDLDSPMKNRVYLGISGIMLLIEGILLYQWGRQKHDAMYIFLPVTMIFLFVFLLQWNWKDNGQRKKSLADLSLIVYIIHPMVIILLRLGAKIIRQEDLLIYNSGIHFIMVTIISFVIGILIIYIAGGGKDKRRKHGRYKKDEFSKDNELGNNFRAWIEIDEAALKSNVNNLKSIMEKGTDIMAVVKDDAYGHGAIRVSTYLNSIGIYDFAVANIEEAIELRNANVKGNILILGYTDPSHAHLLKKYNLIQTIIDYDYALELNKCNIELPVHIKVDTGMHRLGITNTELDKMILIGKMKNLMIRGTYSHLSVADSCREDDIEFTKRQIRDFYQLIDQLKENKMDPGKIHIQSSYGLLNYPGLSSDYVRLGIALYGCLSSPLDRGKLSIELKPVLSLRTKIILIRELVPGMAIGYGRDYRVKEKMSMGVLPIGYGDGYPRKLSKGKGYGIIKGVKRPIIGRVCMDQMMIDITGIEGVEIGEEVTLIGESGGEGITAEEIGCESHTITNEILTGIGKRLFKI